jgi:hypothetical protein
MNRVNEVISETEEKKEENGMEMKAGKKAVRKIADGIQKIKGNLELGIAAASSAIMAALPANVFADVTEVTQPLDNLKTLVVSIIGAIGIIILAKNVMEFAQSYQQQDSASMNSALKGIVAGLIMAAISSVITFLGL